MLCIYVIENIVSHEKYVGITKRDIKIRFKEHLKDAKKSRCSHRKLYKNIRIYGENNFRCYVLEFVNSDIGYEREQFWINKLNTAKCGLNETIGGAGKQFISNIDKKQFKVDSQLGLNTKEIAVKYNCCVDVVRDFLKRNNVNPCDGIVNRLNNPVAMLSKDGEIINTFVSPLQAAKYISSMNKSLDKLGNVSSKIKLAAKNIRKTAYGYVWQFI